MVHDTRGGGTWGGVWFMTPGEVVHGEVCGTRGGGGTGCLVPCNNGRRAVVECAMHAVLMLRKVWVSVGRPQLALWSVHGKHVGFSKHCWGLNPLRLSGQKSSLEFEPHLTSRSNPGFLISMGPVTLYDCPAITLTETPGDGSTTGMSFAW
eukprot:1139133-Pelagomonas_calceolata.AAC.1